jgi:histidyl-tRNA synthetase
MLVPIGDACATAALTLAERLRDAGHAVVLENPARGLKKSLRLADRLNVRQVLLLGEDELAGSAVTLRDLESGEQQTLAVERLLAKLGEVT